MKKPYSETLRTFFHSLWIAIGFALGLLLTGHRNLGAGFAIGASMSLFSLVSLKLCVPALFYKGASRKAAGLLQLTLLMKLPVYAVGLYFATRMGSGPAFAAFVGCSLVPAVISLGALGKVVVQSNSRLRSAGAMREPIVLLPAVEQLSRQVAEIKADACEPIALPAHTRVIREGAG